ncbi:hypothetical protein Bhyg_07985, partial [Pseudolycoriella hygida]
MNKKPDLTNLIECEILNLNKIKAKRQVRLQNFWIGVSERLPAPAVTEQSCGLLNKENSEAVVDIQSIDRSPTISSTYKPPLPAPSQDKIKSDISVLLNDIVVLENRKNSGLINDETLKELKLKKTKVIELQKIIKRKEREMVRHRNRRLQRKRAIEKLSITNPDLKKKLNIRDAIGRPRIESDQPFLLQTIINLALKGSAAHERRRDETIRTVKTLDDLVDKREVQHIYGCCQENKIRLKANDIQHSDSKFAMTTIHHIEGIASILGPNEVTFISQDDKAKIPIGLPAVAKQAPLLMHMEYRVKLPDHDFMIASRHKLTPSVYGFCEIKPNGGGDRSAISFSGPTYAAIRSSKYSSSTAFSHARDIENIYDKSDFIQFTHTASKPKPVFIDIVDGGPDENPRYEKVIQMYIHHFLKCDLDAEIILPHDHFGTHLDDQGRTIDIDLEKTNFSFAGTALAEVWSETIIDGDVTVAEYIDPATSDIDMSSIITKDVNWRDRHVFQSQYLLQIIKCNDSNCCKEMRSSLFKFIPNSGLPAPIQIQQTNSGLNLAD